MSKYTDKIDMRFKYTPAAATDIRQSINREHRRLAALKAEQEARDAAESAKPRATVRKINEGTK